MARTCDPGDVGDGLALADPALRGRRRRGPYGLGPPLRQPLLLAAGPFFLAPAGLALIASGLSGDLIEHIEASPLRKRRRRGREARGDGGDKDDEAFHEPIPMLARLNTA
jgi:hypothetical protein